MLNLVRVFFFNFSIFGKKKTKQNKKQKTFEHIAYEFKVGFSKWYVFLIVEMAG